jgi:type VI secretion system protein ImpG
MAFLTAHVRERIDESRTAVSEQLLSQVCPAQLQPYPSATVIEAHQKSWRQATQMLPAGSLIYSRPAGDSEVACPFALTRELRTHPLTVGEVRADETERGDTRIQMELRATGTTPIDRMGIGPLDFYLHADPTLAVELYGLLTHPSARVRLYGGDESERATHGLVFEPIGLMDEGRVLPAALTGHQGFDLLQDYFCFRERYLFVRLQGLETAKLADDEQRLYIEIVGPGMLPPTHQLSAEHLRLFCVPAVNLYASDSEPVQLDHRRTEYRILADADHPEAVGVYSVDEVQARSNRTGGVTDLWPLYRLRPGSQRRHYHVTRHSHGGAMNQVYVQVGGESGNDTETLSARIRACNNHHPRRHLAAGDISQAGETVPGGVAVTNLTRPGPYRQPPHGREYATRLHAFLTASVGSLADRETATQLLALMDWSDRAANARRVEAIKSLDVTPVNRFHGGVLHQGLELTAHIDEEAFLSIADMRLFGDVLHAFLKRFAPVNQFVALRMVTQPTQRELTWQTRTGQSSPI